MSHKFTVMTDSTRVKWTKMTTSTKSSLSNVLGGTFAIPRLVVVLLGVFFSILLVHTLQDHSSYILDGMQGKHTSTIAPGIPLHIWPIGDSITQGHKSTHSNGYRLFLLNSLLESGSRVTYFGHYRGGNFSNNANSGWGGHTIQEIANALDYEYAKHTNIALLHAGTNDMVDFPRQPVSTAPERLSALIDRILDANLDMTVVVAKITQNKAEGFSAYHTRRYNEAIEKIVEQKLATGSKIVLVDMSAIGANGKDLVDGVHPNDVGYSHMADVWYQGILEANRRKFITLPPDMKPDPCATE